MICRLTNVIPHSFFIVAFVLIMMMTSFLLHFFNSVKNNRKLLATALESIEIGGMTRSVSTATPVIPLPDHRDAIWGMLKSNNHRILLFKPPCVAIDNKATMAIPMVLWMNLWNASQKEIKDEE